VLFFRGVVKGVREMREPSKEESSSVQGKTVEDLIELEKTGELFGLHDDVSNDVYHDPKCPGVSKSGLDIFDRSTEHFVRNKEKKREPTPALIFGNALHCSFLEPDRFKEEFVMLPNECKGTTKVAKEAKAVFTEENKGKVVLSETEWESCKLITESLKRRKVRVKDSMFSLPDLVDGPIENSAFVKDADTDLVVKARPDAFREEHGIVWDLKTTTDASVRGFEKSIANFGYHVQAALILDVMRAIGTKVDSFGLIAVEKAWPFKVSTYIIDDAVIERGREIYRERLARFAEFTEYLKSNGSPDLDLIDLETIGLPAWAWTYV